MRTSDKIVPILVIFLGIIALVGVLSMGGYLGKGAKTASISDLGAAAGGVSLPGLTGEQTGKPIATYTARIIDGDSGSFVTTGTVFQYRGTDDPWDPTKTAFAAFSPNTAFTYGTNAPVAGDQIKAFFLQAAGVAGNIYGVSRYGMTGNRISPGTITVPSGVTAATLTVVDTGWPVGYAQIAIPDPLAENGPTGNQGFPGNNESGSFFGTGTWRSHGSNQYQAGRDNCIAIGVLNSTTPSNGNTLFWNNTNCNGNIRIRIDIGTSGTGNRRWRAPCAIWEDPNFNRTANIVSAATLTRFTGDVTGLVPAATEVSSHINNNLKLNMWSGDNMWLKSGQTSTYELSMTYANATWGPGQQTRMVLEDNCDTDDSSSRNKAYGLTNNTGAASTVAFTLERSTLAGS